MVFSFKKHPFVWTLLVGFVLFYVIKNAQGRFTMNDILVDYTAAQHLLHGQPIYNHAFGLTSGFYKYSPFMLFLLIPLAVLPFFWAKTLYFCITAGLIIYVTIFLERLLTEIFFQHKPVGCQRLLFLSTLVVAVNYERELGLGNHNVLILTVLLLSLNFILKQQEVCAGILIGLVLLMKPYFLVLVPLFVLRRKLKTLASVMGCILFGLAFPAIAFGWGKNIELHAAWLKIMFAHNAEVNLLAQHADVNFTRNSLAAWLYRAGLKYLYPDVGAFYALAVILAVACLVFVFVLWNYAKERRCGTKHQQITLAAKDFSFEYLLLIAMIPNLFVTDSEHFLWSLPIIMFIWAYLLYEHRRRDALFGWSILIFVLYGGDWYELWGRKLSQWIETAGLLGLGNILMLFTAVYIFRKSCRVHGQARREEEVERGNSEHKKENCGCGIL